MSRRSLGENCQRTPFLLKNYLPHYHLLIFQSPSFPKLEHMHTHKLALTINLPPSSQTGLLILEMSTFSIFRVDFSSLVSFIRSPQEGTCSSTMWSRPRALYSLLLHRVPERPSQLYRNGQRERNFCRTWFLSQIRVTARPPAKLCGPVLQLAEDPVQHRVNPRKSPRTHTASSNGLTLPNAAPACSSLCGRSSA